jgi:sulfur-carrier protein
MTVKVIIPNALQRFTRHDCPIECSSCNVAEVIDQLETKCPGIKARLCDDNGKPYRFLNFYVNDEDIRFLNGIKTVLMDGDKLSIVTAVTGG